MSREKGDQVDQKRGQNPAFSDVRFYSVLLKKELKVIL